MTISSPPDPVKLQTSAPVVRPALSWHWLLIGGAAAVALGAALSWDWLVAIGVAPILLAVLPCAAMCALGLCMRGGRR